MNNRYGRLIFLGFEHEHEYLLRGRQGLGTVTDETMHISMLVNLKMLFMDWISPINASVIWMPLTMMPCCNVHDDRVLMVRITFICFMLSETIGTLHHTLFDF